MRRSSNLKGLGLATFFLCVALIVNAQPPKAAVRRTPAKSVEKTAQSEPPVGTVQPSLPALPVAHLDSSVGLKVSGHWQVETEDGKQASLSTWLPRNGISVLLFLSPRDPATLACAERIDKLGDEFSPKKAAFLGISVNRNESLQELKVLEDRLDWNFPIVRDSSQVIARNLKARFTPEVMVVQSGVVKYAGPIDDCWYDARQVKASYLRQVLETLLKGRSLPAMDPVNYGGRAIE